MRKIVIIILAVVIALSALPITFACYNGGWNNWNWWWQPQKPVYCCPENCKLIFTSVSTGDNEEVKDVGETTACINCCGTTLTITIDNAYPGYQGIVDFCVKNTGSKTATITGITPNISDPGYLQIDLTGAIQIGTVIGPCNPKCGQLVIGGLPQEGTQNRTFTFDITIDYNCTCTPPGGGCGDGGYDGGCGDGWGSWGGWYGWGSWGGWGGYNNCG